MLEVVKINKTGYGYEKGNPIKTFSSFGSYYYINSLHPKEGTLVRWNRDCSLHSPIEGHILDTYSIFVLYVDAISKQAQLRQYQLYIDMYYFYNDNICLEDFEFKKD